MTGESGVLPAVLDQVAWKIDPLTTSAANYFQIERTSIDPGPLNEFFSALAVLSADVIVIGHIEAMRNVLDGPEMAVRRSRICFNPSM
jgi:hypothetical protein